MSVHNKILKPSFNLEIAYESFVTKKQTQSVNRFFLMVCGQYFKDEY